MAKEIKEEGGREQWRDEKELRMIESVKKRQKKTL